MSGDAPLLGPRRGMTVECRGGAADGERFEADDAMNMTFQRRDWWYRVDYDATARLFPYHTRLFVASAIGPR